MKANIKKVLIMAGGTGGHVFPGLAVAAYFKSQNVEVEWLGTAQGIEAKLVPEANIPLHLIPIKGLRGKNLLSLIQAPFRILSATLRAAKIIYQQKPDIVIGFGGFVSGPGGLAAWLMRRKLIIHEQNALSGFTNRLLARMASRVLTAFPGAFPAAKKVQVIGNPVRLNIEQLPAPSVRQVGQHQPWRLLVLGGSLGAQAINNLLPAVIAGMPALERPQILHQAGSKLFAEAHAAYVNAGVDANVQPFIQDMAGAYQWADVVLCRAGALTVSELCAAGLGAILVPYPHAVDDHQTHNAMVMVKANAAICLQQCDLTQESLRSQLEMLQADPSKMGAMANCAYQLRQVGVAEKIYAICQEVLT